jgi:hypothetical protein
MPMNKIFISLPLLLAMLFCAKTDDKNIFKDDFNRPDGDLGDSYVKYLPSSSTFTISSGRAYPQFSTAAPAVYYNSSLSGTFKIDAKFIISGGTYSTGIGYIIARSQSTSDVNNAYLCGLYNNTLILAIMKNGTSSVVGNTALYNLYDGKTEHIEFTLDQTSLKCRVWAGVDETSILFNDGTYTQGYAGLCGGASSNYLYFDDLDISKL